MSTATLDEPWFRNSIDSIHAKATRVIAPAAAAGDLLRQSGLPNVAVVRPGVDTTTYQPRVYNYLVLPRPVTLLLGAPIDNLELRDFLEMPLPGSRAVYAPGWTGQETVNSVRIFGYLPPSELARLISAADACVIPGTGPETLLTSLQSLACGVPVAARRGRYVADLLVEADVGAADDDLVRAVATAFGANRQVCRGLARRYSWTHAARRVLETGLQPRPGSYAERDVA